MVIEVLAGVFALALVVSAAEPQPSGEYQPRIDKDGWEIAWSGARADPGTR
jgi:hypothetical protein